MKAHVQHVALGAREDFPTLHYWSCSVGMRHQMWVLGRDPKSGREASAHSL